MNPSEQIARGVKAKSLLEDPLYLESFEIAKRALFDKFERAGSDEEVVRAKQLLTALSLARRVLEQAVRDGKVAERTLEEERRGIVPYLGDVWHSRRSRETSR